MQYQSDYEKMTKMPVEKLVLKLGLPTTISMLVTNIYNVADTYFVSKLGTSASGATGVIFALMAIIQAFGFMLGHGAGSNISRRLGAKKVEEAKTYASTSFFLAIGCGICMAMLGMLLLTPLVRLLGSTDTILPFAKTYAFYILLAAPAMTTSCVMNNILRYEGKAFYAMIGLVSGGILNIAGDYFLIMQCGLGIEGAGIATAASQYISALILLIPFLRGKTQSCFWPKYFAKQFFVVKSILFVGFPSMLRQGLASVSVMLLNLQAAVYGDAAIAAMSIVSRVINFLFCVGLGIGQGFQPVSAYNYGAKIYSRVKRAAVFSLAFGTTLLSIFAVIGFIFAEEIVTLFRDDPKVIEIGTVGLHAQCISLFFISLAACGSMLFQSIGEGRKAAFLASLRSGVCFVPVILILPSLIGIRGIQFAQTIADMLSCAITLPLVINFFRQIPADGEEMIQR